MRFSSSRQNHRSLASGKCVSILIYSQSLLIQTRYYEGKEFETSLKEKRPGDLSPELVEALSIPPLAPPPWLISMQRFGPPPSYPTLRIPASTLQFLKGKASFLTHPILFNPAINHSAQWGFHPGGWGKPPLDEYNRPLYGDVFGVLPKAGDSGVRCVPISSRLVFYLSHRRANLSIRNYGVN